MSLCVFITSVVTSQSSPCVQGMKLISSLQLRHDFNRPISWSDFQVDPEWPLGTLSYSYINLYEFTIFQLSLFRMEVTYSYSDESSSAPCSVLKSSNMTRERCRHVTALMLGICKRGFGSFISILKTPHRPRCCHRSWISCVILTRSKLQLVAFQLVLQYHTFFFSFFLLDGLIKEFIGIIAHS